MSRSAATSNCGSTKTRGGAEARGGEPTLARGEPRGRALRHVAQRRHLELLLLLLLLLLRCRRRHFLLLTLTSLGLCSLGLTLTLTPGSSDCLKCCFMQPCRLFPCGLRCRARAQIRLVLLLQISRSLACRIALRFAETPLACLLLIVQP